MRPDDSRDIPKQSLNELFRAGSQQFRVIQTPVYGEAVI